MKANINIQELLDTLKKRWKLILICTLTATLLSAIGTFFLIKPQYETGTKVFIGKEETKAKVKDYDNNEVIMYQKLLKTYSEVIKTKDLAKATIKDSNVDIKPEELLSNLTIVPLADTQILQIKFKSEMPNDAKKIVSAITDQFIELSSELVPNGNIQILEDVQVPKNPVSPNKKMNIAIAVLLGLMVGLGLTFLLEFLDDTFKSKDQMERELEIAVIGVIPNIDED
ncbi:capsular biosynthesis protein [Clostridium gasigenes]|uniref:YveK family protein n=1 Tax=Clostridium gasigenes TaxID=94869 RepID=UPI001C0CDA92|nr:Wzz/FepE/Etk N-terminal domain-containing protein [Clostridium gasigenes]MBU3134081.1 capsular biosynthesis protein [Clostridium gasigenes]